MQVHIDLRVLARPLDDTLWEKLNARWRTGNEIAVSAERAIRLDAVSMRSLACFEREMRQSGRRIVWKGAVESIGHVRRLLSLTDLNASSPCGELRGLP